MLSSSKYQPMTREGSKKSFFSAESSGNSKLENRQRRVSVQHTPVGAFVKSLANKANRRKSTSSALHGLLEQDEQSLNSEKSKYTIKPPDSKVSRARQRRRSSIFNSVVGAGQKLFNRNTILSENDPIQTIPED